jgi:cytochrome c-type biogenesis protein CcmH/NrfG
MHSFKLLFTLFYRPASAMSAIIDRGSWFFAAALVLLISAAFFFTVNTKLQTAYAAPDFSAFYQTGKDFSPEEREAQYRNAVAEFQRAVAAKQEIPVVGDYFFKISNFETGGFAKFFFALSVFYVPAIVLLITLFGSAGKFGERLPGEYGALATCTLMAWAAAHLPFAIAGVWLYSQDISPLVYLGMWTASSVLFVALMVFAVRTVFGANYRAAILVAALASLAISLAMNVFQLVSPWMLAPFALFYIYTFFSTRIGSEISGYATAFRQKQKAKRALETAAANPYDAAPHVQLGLIYRQRRQDAKSLAHFTKAFEIDGNEIEANYELGKLARATGDLQTAINHFGAVVQQNERHALSEIWREIGATYLTAGMLSEAREALEKFAERRPFDAEGLYYLGKVLKAQSEHRMARDAFAAAVESVNTSPIYRRREVRYWSKLAEKEI